MVNSNHHGSWREKIMHKKVLFITALVLLFIGGAAGAALLKASDNPSFCNTCHIMKPYYQSWQESNLLANKHAEAEVECHDCHAASISTQLKEGFTYLTGTYQVPLEKRVFEKEFCLECHDDFEAIKNATSFKEGNPHDSHNGEQECNLCHNMHQPSQVMCSQCHFFSWVNGLDEGWIN